MLKIAIIVSFTLLAAACSSTQEPSSHHNQSSLDLTAISCVFPDSTQQKSPSWVCDEAVNGLAVQAMGMSDNAAAGIGHQRQLAILDAQTLLAAQLKNKTKLAIDNYSATQGQAGQVMIAKKSSLTQSLVVDKELTGMKIYQSLISDGKVYYTLVGMDDATLKENVKKIIVQSIQKDTGLWQPLITPPMQQHKGDTQQSQEQLAAAISAYVR